MALIIIALITLTIVGVCTIYGINMVLENHREELELIKEYKLDRHQFKVIKEIYFATQEFTNSEIYEITKALYKVKHTELKEASLREACEKAGYCKPKKGKK